MEHACQEHACQRDHWWNGTCMPEGPLVEWNMHVRGTADGMEHARRTTGGMEWLKWNMRARSMHARGTTGGMEHAC